MLRDKNVLILDTTKYVEDFEDIIRRELNPMDLRELFTQLLTAVEMYHADCKRAGRHGRVKQPKLELDTFMFANFMQVDAAELSSVFAEIVKDLYRDMISQRMIELNGAVMYGFDHMTGKDLAVRRFNN